MQYTVVHSKDPYLLARLATDLQMDSEKYKPFHDDPFEDGKYWLCIYKDCDFGFYKHNCKDSTERRFVIKDDNYIKVLTPILQP